MSPRATRRTIFVVAGVVLSLAACKDLEGREGNRKGSRLFRESAFVDAAFEYEQALKKVNDPKIQYNLGLTYSKIFHPGSELILVGEQREDVCNGTGIPGVVPTEPEICLKEGDRHYNDCKVDLEPLKKDVTDAHDKFLKPQGNLAEIKMVAERLRDIYTSFHVEDLEPIDTWAKLASLGVKQRVEVERIGANMTVNIMTLFGVDDTDDITLMIKDDDDLYRRLEGDYEGAKAYLSRMTCSSSFKCTKAKMCALTSRQVADLAVTHWLDWLANGNPEDRETRILMSKLWLQSQQHQKALDYWKGLLEKSPKDTKIMNNIAEIYQDAGEETLDQATQPVIGWRAGMDWYRRVADASTDDANKVAALQYIGRVVWAKLNERRLSMDEVSKLANIGLGALQEAASKQPNNTALWALQYSIWNYRSLAHGSSWAGALDRATSQDLVRHMRVLNDQAKKAQTTAPAEGGKSGS